MARSFYACAAFVAVAVVLTGATFLPRATRGVARNDSSSRYSYRGVVYDRALSALSRNRLRPSALDRSHAPLPNSLPGAPYVITDLNPIVATLPLGPEGFYTGDYGIPTGVANTGHIAVWDPCGCYNEDYPSGSLSGVIDDSGHVYNVMHPLVSVYAGGDVIVEAVNNTGAEAGHWYEHDIGPNSGNQGWSDDGKYDYIDGAHGGDTALAINDVNRAVGRDVTPTGTYAAIFSYTRHRVDLLSPKGSSCLGAAAPMATGVNNSGQIVGYACDTATAFSEQTYARYLPVAPEGVSSAAQAINARGDVVGSAGAQAFVYHGGHTIYLPRPAGEAAGNAVAYAINVSDEIVGEIYTANATTPFLYRNGVSYDLNSLLPASSGWQLTTANGINDSGQIVGTGIYTGENGPAGYSIKPSVAN